jgi:hypothetical protein
MKVYIICFDGDHICHPTAFLDREKAEERLRIMQDEMDADADKHQCKSYSQWYSVEELEMERPIKLSTEGTLKFLEMLDGQAEPNENLRKAALESEDAT